MKLIVQTNAGEVLAEVQVDNIEQADRLRDKFIAEGEWTDETTIYLYDDGVRRYIWRAIGVGGKKSAWVWEDED